MTRLRTAFFLVTTTLSIVRPQAPPPHENAVIALDEGRLALIKPRMQAAVDEAQIAGAVTLVARHGRVAHLEAVGFQNLATKTPLQKNSIFQIMSMTKPVTGVAIMMLVEEGKLTLKDPVETYLPEFREQVVRDPDGATRKPTRPVQIHDLMSHTSGVPSGPCPDFPDAKQTLRPTLEVEVACAGHQPLRFMPGTRWEYSNDGIATLGRIVEVVSGMPFDAFVKKRILEPLGMNDTFFFPTAATRARISMVYKHELGKLVLSGGNILAGAPDRFREGAVMPAPDFGLYSTAHDLFAFCQMLLNGGTFAGQRLLSRASIDVMTVEQTVGMNPAGWLGGTGYGLTFEVVRDHEGALRYLTKGSYGHGGAFGTAYEIDPVHEVVTIYLVGGENAPNHVRDTFWALAASAIN